MVRGKKSVVAVAVVVMAQLLLLFSGWRLAGGASLDRRRADTPRTARTARSGTVDS